MYSIIKRLFDIISSSVAIILLSPLFILIIIILKFSGEGEIFYFQKRLGYKNIEFYIYKFVTMIKDSPNIGTGSITLRNDPRVLPIGKYLRKTKINELPQFFNVFVGNMSIVGPRPQMKIDFDKFSNYYQNNIYKSKPGITGIGSIIFRDEERLLSNTKINKHEFYKKYIAPYKGELEIWYYKNKTIFIDLTIILLTIWVIIFPNSNLIYNIFKSLPKKPKELI
tara:strand:+ start:692 stop:1363 length:672 start_codon:yes stop_codon:yes gene_type:complete